MTGRLRKTWTKEEADRWLAEMKAKRAARKAARKPRKSPGQIERDERAARYLHRESKLVRMTAPPPPVRLVSVWEGRPDRLAEDQAFNMARWLEHLGFKARREYDAAGQITVWSNAPMETVRQFATGLARLVG